MGILLRNDSDRYGLVALVLHWLIALSILGMIGVGLYMTSLPDTPDKFAIYQLHKSFGLTIFGLSLLRLIWRLINPIPPMPMTLSGWERVAARMTHLLFYVLMIVIPLSGWAMVSASPLGIPTHWFGLFEVPHLPVLSALTDKEAAQGALKELHELVSFTLLGLLGLHVGAALRHHFLLHDRTLVRMLPAGDLVRRPFSVLVPVSGEAEAEASDRKRDGE